MTSEDYGSQTAADPFTKFWTDMMSKMGPSGVTPPFGVSQEEISRQMRQACFDSWAKYCDDFMRSDAFLDAMKKSMDGALAFRQQINDFLKKAVGDSPLASSDDTETIVMAVRSLEERVLDRIEALSRRVEALERRLPDQPPKPKSAPPKSKGNSR